jgi:hypothetical protein
MTTTPIVALQKTKEISLNEIETELSQIWHFQNSDKAEAGAVRAATFSMVVYEPEEFQQLLAILGFYKGAIDGIYSDMTKAAVYEARKLTTCALPAALIRKPWLDYAPKSASFHPNRKRYPIRICAGMV